MSASDHERMPEKLTRSTRLYIITGAGDVSRHIVGRHVKLRQFTAGQCTVMYVNGEWCVFPRHATSWSIAEFSTKDAAVAFAVMGRYYE